MAIELFADFETTAVRVYDIKTKTLSRELSETWVCAWGIMPVELDPSPEHIHHGRSIDEFMAYLEAFVKQLPKSQRNRGLTVFTHNLKFDGDFIMYWLLDGRGHIDDEIRENVLYSFKGIWNGISVTFRDSLKIFPQSIDALGSLYGIKKLKGEWDYEKFRYPDDRTPISSEEWGYVDHDVMIGSRALADYRSRGYTENTQASIAYNDRLRKTYPWFRKLFATRFKKIDYDRFVSMFPKDIRPLKYELHKHLLLGYFGGISYVNPFYARRDLEDIDGYDVHSMYPGQMHDAPLPVGDPLIINNPSQEEALRLIRTYPCVMADIEDLTVSLKSPQHFPVLMFPTNPYTSIRMQGKIIKCEDELTVMTGLDYLMMESEYDIKSCRITRIYFFSSKVGQYAAFVDYWMGIKSDSDKIRNDPASTPEQVAQANVNRNIAKVMMNASYGKDGTKMIRRVKKSYMAETRLLELDDSLEIADIEYYLPTAIFITAWARRQLWKAVKACRKDGVSYFVYCDTDSVKVTQEGSELLREAPDVEIDDYKLGTWGYEGTYLTARFVRQKTYSYTIMEKGKVNRHYVVCGAPDDIKSLMKIDDFLPGMKITLEQLHSHKGENGKPLQGRLLPVRVKGGVILEETGFQIAPIDNWDEYQGRNIPIDYALLCKVLSM